ncbi:MAG TPA: beta-ketoacyl synthase N-terminal-like domain-containing protein [Micromonosporaceae bacterium]
MTTVLITGAGASTPLGGDLTASWRALLASESGVRHLTEDWAERLPVRVAALGNAFGFGGHNVSLVIRSL